MTLHPTDVKTATLRLKSLQIQSVCFYHFAEQQDQLDSAQAQLNPFVDTKAALAEADSVS